MRLVWRVTSFDPAVPMTLRLVLDSDDVRCAQLVEQAAHEWGVELERVYDERLVDVVDLAGNVVARVEP